MSKIKKCRGCKKKFEVPEDNAKWRKQKLVCPLCNISYSILDKTEASLRIIQDIAYKNIKKTYTTVLNKKGKEKPVVLVYDKCNTEQLGKMFPILQDYANSKIKRNFRRYIKSADQLEYHAQQTASFFIEDYLKPKKDGTYLYIDDSFGGYLPFKIKQSLFGKKEYMFDDVSFNYDYEDGKESFEIGHEDTNRDLINNELDGDSLVAVIQGLLETISNHVPDREENFRRLIAFSLNLEKGETQTDKFFEKFGRKGKISYLKTLEIVKAEILKRR